MYIEELQRIYSNKYAADLVLLINSLIMSGFDDSQVERQFVESSDSLRLVTKDQKEVLVSRQIAMMSKLIKDVLAEESFEEDDRNEEVRYSVELFPFNIDNGP